MPRVDYNQMVKFTADINNVSKDEHGLPAKLFGATVSFHIHKGNILPLIDLPLIGSEEWMVSTVVDLAPGANAIAVRLTIGTAFSPGAKDVVVVVSYNGKEIGRGGREDLVEVNALLSPVFSAGVTGIFAEVI